jgi:TPR repeat protein
MNCFAQPAPPDKALDLLRQRAEAGYVKQQIELAAAYLTGRGVPQDNALAAHWYERAAQGGNPEAANEIGYFYQQGIGVPVDQARAVHWFQLSSASGFIMAKLNLGINYLRGLGVPPNPSTAARLFHEAVDKGFGLGATYLGDMDFFGMGVPLDKASAERWFEVGAKLHDPESAYNLACLYSDTHDHAHDFPRAAGLLRASSNKGYVPAKHALGRLLLNHPDLAESDREAPLLLETASTAGYWRSTVLLAVMVRDGNHAAADPTQAFYNFHLAALQGGPVAERLVGPDLSALARKLSPDEQSSIAARAQAWFQQHSQPATFVLKESETDRNFPLLALSAPPSAVQ